MKLCQGHQDTASLSLISHCNCYVKSGRRGEVIRCELLPKKLRVNSRSNSIWPMDQSTCLILTTEILQGVPPLISIYFLFFFFFHLGQTLLSNNPKNSINKARKVQMLRSWADPTV